MIFKRQQLWMFLFRGVLETNTFPRLASGNANGFLETVLAFACNYMTPFNVCLNTDDAGPSNCENFVCCNTIVCK